jgi:hypothetical protein
MRTKTGPIEMKHLLRLYGNLSRDVLTLDVRNDNAVPTELPGGHDENENETTSKQGAYSDFTGTSAGMS